MPHHQVDRQLAEQRIVDWRFALLRQQIDERQPVTPRQFFGLSYFRRLNRLGQCPRDAALEGIGSRSVNLIFSELLHLVPAAICGPATTNLFPLASTTAPNPSSVCAPRRFKSPRCPKTISSTVSNSLTRRIAYPISRDMISPFAIMNSTLRLRTSTPTVERVSLGIQVNSEPVSTMSCSMTADFSGAAIFSTVQST